MKNRKNKEKNTEQAKRPEAAEKNAERPVYGIASNCAFMIRCAWRDSKIVLVILAGLVVCGVAGNLLELFVVPAVLGAVERGVSAAELVRLILWFTFGLVSVHSLLAYLQENAIFGRIQVRTRLTQDVHMTFCRTSFPHTEEDEYLKSVQKASRPLDTNRSSGEAIWRTMGDLATDGIGFAVYLLLLASVSPWVIVLTFSLAAVSFFVGRNARSYRYRHRKEDAEHMRRLGYVVYSSHDTKLGKDVRLFGLGPWMMEFYEKNVQFCTDFKLRCEMSVLRAEALDVLFSFLRNAVAYGWLLVLALRGELTAAEFVLYFTAVGGFTARVTGIFKQFAELSRQSMELSAMREFFDTAEPFLFETGKPLPIRPECRYTLELRDVSFRYPGAGQDTLSHVNLTIRPGEKLAVVGKNGAGKTTLIKLLCGLYDPTEGAVLLNGEDIRQYDRRDYYKHFSAVFQQFSVLAGTVAENVAQCGGEAVDVPRMWDCLERAGLAEAVCALPKQENTILGREVYLDGVELSGGQLQKLMLARALYKDAPIVLLDEPTAALDPLAESELYQKYSALVGGRASVYISHRLASTRFCDRILLVEDGGIAEEGTHEQLLALGGRYAYLFGLQSRYYEAEERHEAGENGEAEERHEVGEGEAQHA